MKRISKWIGLVPTAALPWLAGTSCSTNEIAQSAVTTFLNSIATNAVGTFFRLTFPM